MARNVIYPLLFHLWGANECYQGVYNQNTCSSSDKRENRHLISKDMKTIQPWAGGDGSYYWKWFGRLGMDKQAQATAHIISLRDRVGREAHIRAHILLQKMKRRSYQQHSQLKEKYFPIILLWFFFCTILSLGAVMWQAVRTSKCSGVASSESESEKAYPGSEGGEQTAAKITCQGFHSD